MASLNKVCIIGRMGKDPELRRAQSGVAVTSFSLATSEKYKDKQGNQQEETEWHNCSIWNKGAEIIAQYCQKGSLLYVEGKLKTRSWEDNGVKKYATDIVVRDFQFLSPKGDSQPQQQNNGGGFGEAPQNNGFGETGFDVPQQPEFQNNAPVQQKFQ
jgi:single-strand DNA-binding protein